MPILDYVPPSADDADLQLKWAEAFPQAVRIDEARERIGLSPLLGTAGAAFATGKAESAIGTPGGPAWTVADEWRYHCGFIPAHINEDIAKRTPSPHRKEALGAW